MDKVVHSNIFGCWHSQLVELQVLSVVFEGQKRSIEVVRRGVARGGVGFDQPRSAFQAGCHDEGHFFLGYCTTPIIHYTIGNGAHKHFVQRSRW